MSNDNTTESLLSNLDFTPDWAKTSADDYVERYKSDSYTSPRHESRNEGMRRPRRDRDDRDEANSPRRDRPPRRQERGQERRTPRDGAAAHIDTPPAFPADRAPRGERATTDRSAPRRPRREFVQQLNAEIRLLPGQKNLGTVMKRIQSSHQAYPIKSFVNLFIDNPSACLVRLESKKDDPKTFYQCKKCGFVALDPNQVEQHIMGTHFEEYYTPEVIACQPPSGAFSSVNRCTLTGEWLGAPNHHSYKHRVAELAARAQMSEQRYLSSSIETLRDEASIEAWKQTMTSKKVYKLAIDQATQSEAEDEAAQAMPAIEFDAAEMLFKRDIMPKIIASASHVCCPVSIAEATPDASIKLLLKNTIRNETRSPRSLFFALRGAFRHHKFHLFRANDSRGAEFVMGTTPSMLDIEHVTPVLKQALGFVIDHPYCVRRDLMAALTDGKDGDALKEVASQVSWLLSKGHLIEFYNGMLAIPADFPLFKKLPEELGQGIKESEEKPAEPIEAVAPVAEPAEPIEAAEVSADADTPQA